MKRFRADLIISDTDCTLLQKSNILRIGEAVLEVTSEKKQCYPADCDFYKDDIKCPLENGCAFLRVIIPGRVYEGAKIMKVDNND